MWDRMKKMQEEMDRAFGDFFSEPGGILLPAASNENNLPAATKAPPLFRATADLYETEKEIVAKFDLPGVKKGDISVETTSDQLQVRVEKKSEHEEKRKNSYFMERSYSGYFRALPLPPYAKAEGIKADYKDGVLTVRVPKDEDKAKTKKTRIIVD